MTMDDRRLVSLITQKLGRSLNDEGGEVSKLREDNFDRYYGKDYGNEEDGYSSYVSRECLEVVEWAIPSVMKVFLAGDRIVEFDAVGEDDEDDAKQETDVVNHWLLQKNKGFMALYELIKDCLMNPVAYAKVWIDERERTTTSTYRGILQQQFDELQAEKENEVELLGQDVIELYGEAIPTFDCRVTRTEALKDIKFDALAPEEVLIDRNCVALDVDSADFVCHRARRSMSYLVEDGIPPEDLEGLHNDSEREFDDERTNRLFYEEEHPQGGDVDDDTEPTRQFWVTEVWGYFDVDEDEVAEQRHILMIGDEIFENEEMEFQPIVAVSAIPIPHKHTGMSYIEAVKDLQLISSDLYRQLLNNVYKQNVRKMFIHDAAMLDTNETMNQFLDPDSEIVVTRLPPEQSITYEQPSTVIMEILEAIKLIQERPQMRSGVSPQLSLDPEVLQQSTEGAFTQAMDWANQRLETLVRIFAETAMKPIMLKAHQLSRLHMDVPKAVKLNGKWIDISPQDWRTREDMTVNVGLGFNTKQEKLGVLTNVLAAQKEALPYGLANLKGIYNTLERMVMASGAGPVSAFFIDPEDPEKFEPPEPKADPGMIVAEAEKMKAETESQTKPKQIDAEIKKTDSEAQLKTAEAQHAAQAEKTKMEISWAEIRNKKRELDLKERELDAEIARESLKVDAEVGLKKAETTKTREETTALGIDNSDLADQLSKTVKEGEKKQGEAA